jgi:hypothetical protein
VVRFAQIKMPDGSYKVAADTVQAIWFTDMRRVLSEQSFARSPCPHALYVAPQPPHQQFDHRRHDAAIIYVADSTGGGGTAQHSDVIYSCVRHGLPSQDTLRTISVPNLHCTSPAHHTPPPP